MTADYDDDEMPDIDYPTERRRAAVVLFVATCLLLGRALRHSDLATLILAIIGLLMLLLMLWRIRLDSHSPEADR